MSKWFVGVVQVVSYAIDRRWTRAKYCRQTRTRNAPILQSQRVDKISQYLVVSHGMISVVTGWWDRFLLDDRLSSSVDQISAAVEAPFQLINRHLVLLVSCQKVVERQNCSLETVVFEHLVRETNTIQLLALLLVMPFQEANKHKKVVIAHR